MLGWIGLIIIIVTLVYRWLEPAVQLPRHKGESDPELEEDCLNLTVYEDGTILPTHDGGLEAPTHDVNLAIVLPVGSEDQHYHLDGVYAKPSELLVDMFDGQSLTHNAGLRIGDTPPAMFQLN